MQSDQDTRFGSDGGRPARKAITSPRWRWLAVFGGGLALWLAAAGTTEVTQNVNLVPTVVLLGSFLVPVTAVVWNFDHEADSALSAQRVLYAFVVGGALGVLGASVLEAWLAQDGVPTYLGVGLVERTARGFPLVWGRGCLQMERRDERPRPPDDGTGNLERRSFAARAGSAAAAAWGAITGVAPHVLHHVGPLAGAAFLAGASGRLLFAGIALVVSVPFLLRIHRRFGTWVAPAIALAVMVATFSLSTFVIGPAISGSEAQSGPQPTVTQPPVHEHGH